MKNFSGVMLAFQFVSVLSAAAAVASVCLKTWTVVPSDGTMKSLDCNVLNQDVLDVTIISTCTVSSPSNVTVHWYYSQERDSAGVNGSILPGIRQSISVNSKCILGPLRLCSAELSITNIRTLDEGYYWCEVDVEESQGLVGRPSSVLRISGCDTLNLCPTQSFLTNLMRVSRCAVSDTGSDIARTNLTFVDLYSGSCSLKPTTPEKVTTTEVEEKPTPSTVGMVPTMTSEPKPDFETTAMSSATPTFTTVATTITTESSTSSSSNSNSSPSSTTSSSTSTSSSSTSSNSSSSIDSSGREISSTSVADEAATSLPLAIIWPVIGGVVGLLLFVVAILLVLILIVQCRKRRGKGEITPNNAVNHTYVDEIELNSSTRPMIHEDSSQLYDEIPPNFILTASSNEHSPNTRNAHNPFPPPVKPPLQDQYEDIDIKPSLSNPWTNQAKNRHQYESVTNEEDEDDYNRLVRSESSSHAQNLSMSFSRTSGSPPQVSSENESAIFDNPKYSQFKPTKAKSNHHVDIYRLESLDSNSGSGSQSRVSKVPLESHSESSGEDFSDISKFAVTGLAKDETKRPTATSEAPPPGQYTKVLPGSMDSDYTQRIVSTDEQYISEQGHVYQVLEKDDGPQESEENHSKRVSSAEDQYTSDQGHIYHILEDPAATEDGTTEGQRNAERHPYSQVMNKNSNSFHSPESSKRLGDVKGRLSPSEEDGANSEPEYDVIDSSGSGRTTVTPTRTERPEYNVIERPGVQRSSVAPQDQHYNVTERNMEHRALLRERSSASLHNRPGAYDVIERNMTPCVPPSRKMPTTVERSPPPNYSSLELSDSEKRDRKFKIEAKNPFYDVLDLENLTECRRDPNNGSTYNSLDTVGKLTMRDGMDNALYHAVS